MLMQIQVREERVGTITPLYIFSSSSETVIVCIRSLVGSEPGVPYDTKIFKHIIPLPYPVVIDALNHAAAAGVAVADFTDIGIAQLKEIYKTAVPPAHGWQDIVPAMSKPLRLSKP